MKPSIVIENIYDQSSDRKYIGFSDGWGRGPSFIGYVYELKITYNNETKSVSLNTEYLWSLEEFDWYANHYANKNRKE